MRNSITVYAHDSLPFMREAGLLFGLIHILLMEDLSTGGASQLGDVCQ